MRLALVVSVAVGVGLVLRQVGRHLDRRSGTAGFGQGLFQGAMMPLAFPTLALGIDSSIYAVNNNGVPYKLGYTMGVTGCGAVFFGVVFSRLSRWRRQL